MYQIICPTCEHHISTPFARVGAVTHCPNCKAKIAVGVKELRRIGKYPAEDSRNLLLVGAAAEAANNIANLNAAAAARKPAKDEPPTPESIEAAIEAGLGLDQPDFDDEFTQDLTGETRESPSMTEADIDDSPSAAPATAAESMAGKSGDAASPDEPDDKAASGTEEAAAEAQADVPDTEASPAEDRSKSFREKMAEKNRAKKQRTPLLIGGAILAVLLLVVGGVGYLLMTGEDSRSFAPRKIGGIPGRSGAPTAPPAPVQMPTQTTPTGGQTDFALIDPFGRPGGPTNDRPQQPVQPTPTPTPQAVETRPTGLEPHLQALVDADLPARPADRVRGAEWDLGYVTAAEMETKPSDIIVSEMEWDVETGLLTASLATVGADPLSSSTVRFIQLSENGRGFGEGVAQVPLLLPGVPYNLKLELPKQRREEIAKLLWEGRPGFVLSNGRSLDDVLWYGFFNGRDFELRVTARNGGATPLDKVIVVILALDETGHTKSAWTVDWPLPLLQGQSAEFVTRLPPSAANGVDSWVVQAAGRSRGRR